MAPSGVVHSARPSPTPPPFPLPCRWPNSRIRLRPAPRRGELIASKRIRELPTPFGGGLSEPQYRFRFFRREIPGKPYRGTGAFSQRRQARPPLQSRWRRAAVRRIPETALGRQTLRRWWPWVAGLGPQWPPRAWPSSCRWFGSSRRPGRPRPSGPGQSRKRRGLGRVACRSAAPAEPRPSATRLRAGSAALSPASPSLATAESPAPLRRA